MRGYTTLKAGAKLTHGPLVRVAVNPACLKRSIAVTHATTATANAAAEVRKASRATNANSGKGYQR